LAVRNKTAASDNPSWSQTRFRGQDLPLARFLAVLRGKNSDHWRTVSRAGKCDCDLERAPSPLVTADIWHALAIVRCHKHGFDSPTGFGIQTCSGRCHLRAWQRPPEREATVRGGSLLRSLCRLPAHSFDHADEG